MTNHPARRPPCRTNRERIPASGMSSRNPQYEQKPNGMNPPHNAFLCQAFNGVSMKQLTCESGMTQTQPCRADDVKREGKPKRNPINITTC